MLESTYDTEPNFTVIGERKVYLNRYTSSI